MKQYDVKYDVGQEVYIIAQNKNFKSKIDKIRIIERGPHQRLIDKEIVE